MAMHYENLACIHIHCTSGMQFQSMLEINLLLENLYKY